MNTMTEEQIAEKLKAAIPEGWSVRCISPERESFILDCTRSSYYLRSVKEFEKIVKEIGKAVDSQPVTTCAYSEDGSISTVFRIGSLNDPERRAG